MKAKLNTQKARVIFSKVKYLPRHDDSDQYARNDDEGDPGRDAEYGHGGRHADVFRHEGAPVYQGEVEDGKPPPERPEAVEDGLGVTPLRDGPEPYRHLLYIVRHGHQDEENPEQVETYFDPVTA